MGGWGEVQLKAASRWTLAVGATLDDPKDDDLSDGGRSYNQTVFGAIRVQPVPRIKLAAEYIYWKTEYKNAPEGIASRIDVHGTMTF